MLQENNTKKRAQVAIEFMVIVGSVMFFMAIFLLAIQKENQSKIDQHQNIEIKEIALTVQNELNLALKSSDGYSRKFKIPATAGNMQYSITLTSGVVYIKTNDGKYSLTLPIPPVIGNINKTQNKIKKIGGQIYLNQ